MFPTYSAVLLRDDHAPTVLAERLTPDRALRWLGYAQNAAGEGERICLIQGNVPSWLREPVVA